ncbi:expressed unknown protein [Ectocarpus siliculosus]|uniref:Uncharacterized protein n=1 Tax=Ectocarpus siliculosus TaxID=2880 RepID=D7G407_ECTSI|nr:expressed unknown protein [Ectocarpus siliculosus]|eukprot:CBJ27042.1 expressed unknown protein [Ectocarpus siliculosus]
MYNKRRAKRIFTTRGNEDPAPEFLEHVVLPDDTLVGICLKYKVREGNKCEGLVVYSFSIALVAEPSLTDKTVAGQRSSAVHGCGEVS